MTEAYRFFGGAVGDPRQYVQTEFAEVLERVFRNGYFPGLNSELQVAVTDPERMAVRVASGQAWINGYYYKNDGWKEIELEPAHADNDRIDRIVLRLDTINERSIVSEVKTGTPSSSPSAPGLDRDDQLWELSLATVKVRAGSSSVSNSNITDTRGDSDLCGKAIARLTPADISAATQQSLDTHIDDEDNPHRVTKSQVGLGSVDNVKQASKTEFDAHKDDHRAHGATYENEPSSIMRRDSQGRAGVSTPASSEHVANKGYVDDSVKNTAKTDESNSFSRPITVEDLLRLTATSESAVIQAGQDSNDLKARLRIALRNTTSTPLELFEIFANLVTINGNRVWDAGNFDPKEKYDKSGGSIDGRVTVLDLLSFNVDNNRAYIQ